MATGLLSQGITLKMANTLLPDLQSIPDLGGDVDTIEVTTFDDSSRRYIKGLKDYGSLEFTFLYDNETANTSYRLCQAAEVAGVVKEFELAFPDTTKFAFSGQVSTVISGTGVGEAMTFTLKVALNSDITITNPTA